MPGPCSLVALAVRAAWLSAAIIFVRHPAIAVEGLSREDMSHGVQPSLALVEAVLATTAKDEFQGKEELYQAAASWDEARLLALGRAGPHVACANYGDGKEALASLRRLLGRENVRRVSNSPVHGSCFIATASATDAAALSKDPARYSLQRFGTFPSVLKISPGLLKLERDDDVLNRGLERLTTTYGDLMHLDNVGGLEVELSPGVLPLNRRTFGVANLDFLKGCLSASINLHASTFWSDLTVPEGGDSVHRADVTDSLRVKEWTRAAEVVHRLSSAKDSGPTPADVCYWDRLRALHGNGPFLVVLGLDHLLPSGSGVGGGEGAEAEELKTACFMTLVSYLAAQPEVLRVAPLHQARIYNAVAKAISQSASISDTPLSDAGLDGTGEVIQVVDSGLDQDSCFFVDYSGEPVEIGFLYDKLGVVDGPDQNTLEVYPDFATGGSYPFDLSRRKVVQYVALAKPPSDDDDSTQSTTFGGGMQEWYNAEGFQIETEGGHGSHTAGTAAGATITTPAQPEQCSLGSRLTCFGGCMDEGEIDDKTSDLIWNPELFCKEFDCDGTGDVYLSCLEEDTRMLLTQNGGVAQGAKLSIYDVSADGETIWAKLAMNELWNATLGTGTMVHSNSWGGDNGCNVDSTAEMFDEYMYNNPEHLLLFAAGNDGDQGRCNIGSPAVGKNTLAVGSSASGIYRWSLPPEDGDISIDNVSEFSSRGPALEGRIKPDLVAPGDQVLSVSSGGANSGGSCQLELQLGTSMSTPVVAASAAMLRQYFRDSEFYEADVKGRGLCASNSVKCEAFTPSAATLKAMLINSANLMGKGSEPDGSRGFGRVHLEAGLPLNGEGGMGLFVADSSWTSIDSNSTKTTSFIMSGGGGGGVEVRATIAWIDPPGSSVSAVQLQHDLDMAVYSPSGRRYTMWLSGADDNVNVMERVIVPAEDVEVEPGRWSIIVTSRSFTESDPQPFSLVVTGPFGAGSYVATSPARRPGSGAALVAMVSTAWVALALFISARLV